MIWCLWQRHLWDTKEMKSNLSLLVLAQPRIQSNQGELYFKTIVTTNIHVQACGHCRPLTAIERESYL